MTMPSASPTELRADCSRCFALCCVALPFTASADFAITKGAGRPCPNLGGDLGCTIHTDLRRRGFAGCAVYDCFGAGQRVSQQTFAGKDWRGDPGTARQMFAVFPVVRHLHELLWYLTESLALDAAASVHPELGRLLAETERLSLLPREEVLRIDLGSHHDTVNDVLLRVSALVRAGAPQPQGDHRGADLVGRDLHGADLRGASLRGALLLGADLRRADLRLADLIGADLRAADLTGADLSTALFVTQAQVEAARGDRSTRLPAAVRRPLHWL